MERAAPRQTYLNPHRQSGNHPTPVTMRPLLPALLLLSLLPALPAQNGPLDPSGAVVPDVRLSREQLKELTGPIALYPDPLVAMILPASTFPSDVVLAARFVQSKDDPSLADE